MPFLPCPKWQMTRYPQLLQPTSSDSTLPCLPFCASDVSDKKFPSAERGKWGVQWPLTSNFPVQLNSVFCTYRKRMAKSQELCGSREDRVSWAQLALCQPLPIPAKIKGLSWEAPEFSSHCETTSSTLHLECLKILFGIFWNVLIFLEFQSQKGRRKLSDFLPQASCSRKIQLLLGSDVRGFTQEHGEAEASSLWDKLPRQSAVSHWLLTGYGATCSSHFHLSTAITGGMEL